MPPYQRQQPTQITRNLNLIDAKPHADEFLCQMQPQIRDRGYHPDERHGKGTPRPARPFPARSLMPLAFVLFKVRLDPAKHRPEPGRGVNPVRYLPHLS